MCDCSNRTTIMGLTCFFSCLLLFGNCNFLGNNKETETITHQTGISYVLFLDSANVTYVVYEYDEHLVTGGSGGTVISFNNYSSALVARNIYTGIADTLIAFPVGIFDYCIPYISYSPPLILVSQYSNSDKKNIHYCYNRESKSAVSYKKDHVLYLTNVPEVAYCAEGDIYHSLIDEKLYCIFSDSGTLNVSDPNGISNKLCFFNPNNNTAFFFDAVKDGPTTMTTRYWLGVYDPSSGAFPTQRVDQNNDLLVEIVDRSRYLLFKSDSDIFSLIHVDSLDADLSYRKSIAADFSQYNLTDLLVQSELTVSYDAPAKECIVRRFNKEVVAQFSIP